MSPSPFPPEIETSRLILRPPTLADAGAIADAVAASYPQLHEWMEWAREPYGLADAQAFCNDAQEAMAAGREYPVLLLRRGDGCLLGSMGLIEIDRAVPKAEIGYWLHSDHVGHGYCSEAARAMTKYAFEELNAQRLEIMMDDRNARSWAVAERLGFELEAVHRAHRRDNRGRLSSTRVYAMFDLACLR